MNQEAKPLPEELRHGPLLGSLSEEQLARIARRAFRCHLKHGEALFRQGDTANRFYLVLTGQIKLYRLSPHGAEKVIDIVSPGATFAEALMFLNRPRFPVGAEAIGSVELISIDSPDFRGMLHDSVETCFLVMGNMSQRLRRFIGEIDNLSLHSAGCRVAGYLSRRAEKEGAEFDLGVPKHVIASKLTVTPETFSRIMKALVQKEVIQVEVRRIKVIDPLELARIAESESVWH
jgi:CRP-like cAMP-binding protein